MTDELKCFFLLALSGGLQACFALPVKHFRQWRWEQMWVAQSATSNLLFPLLWAVLLPGTFWSLAAKIPLSHWMAAYAWGVLWGLGGVAYGLTLTTLGISFSYSFVFGTTTLTGALLPLVLHRVEKARYPHLFAAGLVLCLLAIVSIGLLQRRRRNEPSMPIPFGSLPYSWAVIVSLFAGVFSASYGLAFTFGFPAVRTLISGGVSAVSAPLVVALPVYLGAASVAIPVGLLCAARSRTITWFFHRHSLWNWSLALMMGLCGVGGVVLYGLASSRSGHPPTNISFGIYMTFFVLAGNALGLVTSEMKEYSTADAAGFLLSISVLIGAAWLLNAR